MKEKEKMLLVTEHGIIGSKLTPNEVMSMLLYAYLQVWNDEMFEVDFMEAAKKIVDLMASLKKEEKKEDAFEDILKILFGDDEEEGEE